MSHAVTPEGLRSLLRAPSQIRNMCILAHVDHGKTTLSDCLISSNGIISQKLAGKVRYMDSTEEEQIRGITMKSSAIALMHHDAPHRELRKVDPATIPGATITAAPALAPAPASADGAASPSAAPSAAAPTVRVPYLVNLIDSPGHVDFSMDVTTAARLCDGALVVVDAVEGVCIQTHAVLRTAWSEGLRPALVLNKVDRLITELQLTPVEAYAHLCRILEQANVIMSSLYTADLLAAAAAAGKDAAAAQAEAEAAAATAAKAAAGDAGGSGAERELTLDSSPTAAAAAAATATATATAVKQSAEAWQIDIDEKAEAELFFDPCRGNVLFASAYDGWAFSVDDFARLHAARLGVPPALLRRALWGEWYWKPKAKAIVTGSAAAAAAKGKTMAVALMLEPVWLAYDALVLNPNEDRIGKIIKSLDLEVPKRDLASKDAKIRLQAVMRAWLPAPAALLSMVVRALPSPVEAQAKRLRKLWPSVLANLEGLPTHTPTTTTTPTTVTSTVTSSATTADAQMAAAAAVAVTPDMSLSQRLARVYRGIATCDVSEAAECVVFVSKMFAVPKASLPYPLIEVPAPDSASSSSNNSNNSMVVSEEAFPERVAATSPAAYYGMDTGITGEGGGKLDLTAVNAGGATATLRGRNSGGSANADGSGGGTAADGGAAYGDDPSSVETFIAFARVFSGVLRPDSPVFVLGPRYDPRTPTADGCDNISQVTAAMPLYLMMGRDLSPIPAAYAGSVIGIGRLGSHILKTATLCSTPACPSMSPMAFQTTPLVRVAVEPVNPLDLPAAERGLALLNQADPCVELTVTDTGELQLSALGELHLQRCVKDLETRFARVPLKISPPIMAFQETITAEARAMSVKEARTLLATAAGGGGGGGGGGGSGGAGASRGGPLGGLPPPPALQAAVKAGDDRGGQDDDEEDGSGGSAGAGAAAAVSDAGSSSGLASPTATSATTTGAIVAQIQQANAAGGGPQYPVCWSIPDTGTAYHPPTGRVYCTTPDRSASMRLRAVPLPAEVTRLLQDNTAALRTVISEAKRAATGGGNTTSSSTGALSAAAEGKAEAAAAAAAGAVGSVRAFVTQLKAAFAAAGPAWADYPLSSIVSFGPKSVGPCVLLAPPGGVAGLQALLDATSSGGSSSGSGTVPLGPGPLAPWLDSDTATTTTTASPAVPSAVRNVLSSLRASLVQGFQLATAAGPLCGEPMWGVAFVIEDITLTLAGAAPASAAAAASSAAAEAEAGAGAGVGAAEATAPVSSPSAASTAASVRSGTGPTGAPSSSSSSAAVTISSGQLISVMRDACRTAFQAGEARLVEAYFKCELQCSGGRGGGGEQLGKCYGVLAKRRARVLNEELWEGTQTFVISALLPVVESFGFADELRKKTSGAATSPQLLFSHWEVLETDPYFQPTTEEEREEHGDTLYEGQGKNLARNFMDAVRTRKGMPVEKKIVAHADKQRNLSRKK